MKNPYRNPDPPAPEPRRTFRQWLWDEQEWLAPRVIGSIVFAIIAGGLYHDCQEDDRKAAEEVIIRQDPARDCERFRDKTQDQTPMRCLKYFGVAR